MKMNIYHDESLESLLLRFCHLKKYVDFRELVEDVDGRIRLLKKTVGGKLPSDLSQFNLHKTRLSVERMVIALWFIEKELEERKLLNIDNFNILSLALLTSEITFSSNHAAIHRDGIDYPLEMLREGVTPICPLCLVENQYVRQIWQFAPYTACHKHQSKLISNCPKCALELNYKKNGSIIKCLCGFDLTKCSVTKPSESELLLSNWVLGSHNGLLSHDENMTISSRFGFIHWYQKRYEKSDDLNTDNFIQYCSQWPNILYEELEKQISFAEYTEAYHWTKTPFKAILGDLLADCRYLPNQNPTENIVLQAVLAFLTAKVKASSKSETIDFTATLLSPLEVATLLSCSTNKVERLYQYGELKSSVFLRRNAKVKEYDPIFSLKSVIITRITQKLSHKDQFNLFLPSW